VAYIAGLFDGEGCATVYGYKATKNGEKYWRLIVRIANTHRGVLEWIREQWGRGWIARESTSHNKPGWKQGWTFRLQGRDAAHFLTTLRPHLKIKAERVDEILSNPWRGRVA
jgi:hypothetical protein